MPPSGASAEVSNLVTLDESVTVTNLTIDASQTLTSQSGSGEVLTIASGGSITNNGTFTPNDGTVTFTAAGTVTGATTFNNVNISSGVDLGSGSSVNGILTINSGAALVSHSPSYTSNATLKYNTGGTYGRSIEWNATSGAGYPNNVEIYSLITY